MLKFNDQNEVIREEEYKAILVGVQLGEAVDVAEVDGAVAVEVEEVYGDRYDYRQQAPQECRVGKGHAHPPFR